MLSNTGTKVWQAADARHHVHPFTDVAALAAKGARVIVRAEGVWIEDSEGRRILDGMAGLWCVNVGYGNRELADAGYQALRELPYYNAFFQTTNPYAAELSAKLAEITPPGLERVLFANSGSEANDSIIKLTRYYWNLQGRPQKKIMIGRNYGYHGVTLGAASLSGLTHLHPQFDLPLPGFVHVEAPYWYGEGGDLSPQEFGLKAARSLEAKILELGAENVAAFIGEPIQGAGGVIIPPESYWPEIGRICAEHDVLLIADEVICGFGRTGHWFGSNGFGIRPDFMTLAKGLSSGYMPISAVMLGPRVGDAIANANEELVHGFTYSGHPVACAVALKNIEVLQRDKLVERAGRETGLYLQAGLATLSDHPLVGEVRGMGMIGAVELVADKAARRHFAPELGVGTICRDHCFAHDLIMRAIRDIMVVSPPLTITRAEIDELIRRARICLDLTARDLSIPLK
jgi:putrescine---pyruvate transaminase